MRDARSALLAFQLTVLLVLALALVALAAASSFLPARRAARVDPVIALRDG